jgi:hypothetical protein
MRHVRPPIPILTVAVLALALAGCATESPPPPPTEAAPPVVPTLPPAFPAQELIGSWGLAAYHVDTDRSRIETAAAQQCRQPYVVTAGPTGGIMMHLADQATPTELVLKGAPGGKTYVGVKGEPPGSTQDRLVEHFDGKILILRWVDPEVQGRYGTMVYVRCAPEKPKRHNVNTPAKPKPKPAAKPKAT